MFKIALAKLHGISHPQKIDYQIINFVFIIH